MNQRHVCLYESGIEIGERRPLERPKCRCVDNIKMDLGERENGVA
jgi:hypothetical protein